MTRNGVLRRSVASTEKARRLANNPPSKVGEYLLLCRKSKRQGDYAIWFPTHVQRQSFSSPGFSVAVITPAHQGRFVPYFEVSTDRQCKSGLGLEAQRNPSLTT